MVPQIITRKFPERAIRPLDWGKDPAANGYINTNMTKEINRAARSALILRRPHSVWFDIRERLVRLIAKNLDVPVSIHFSEGQPPFDCGPGRFLFLFERYNHMRDGLPIIKANLLDLYV